MPVYTKSVYVLAGCKHLILFSYFVLYKNDVFACSVHICLEKICFILFGTQLFMLFDILRIHCFNIY